MRLKRFATPFAAIALALFVGNICADEKRADEDLAKMADEYNAKVEDESKEVVCRMVSKVGSRIKEKQCRTKAQIKQDEDEAERFARKQKQSFKSN